MTNGKLLAEQALEILREEPWYVAAFSNLSALLMSMLPDLNWAGFYLYRDGRHLRRKGRDPGGTGRSPVSGAYRLRLRFPLGDRAPPARRGTGEGGAGYRQPPAGPLREGSARPRGTGEDHRGKRPLAVSGRFPLPEKRIIRQPAGTRFALEKNGKKCIM